MENYDKMLELLGLSNDVHCFEFDGLLVKGYKVDVIKEYIKQNPSKKFRVWLIDTQEILIPSK